MKRRRSEGGANGETNMTVHKQHWNNNNANENNQVGGREGVTSRNGEFPLEVLTWLLL